MTPALTVPLQKSSGSAALLLFILIIAGRCGPAVRDSDHLFDSGMAHFLHGNYAAAYSDFAKVASPDGARNEWSRLYMGICMFETGDMKRAERHLNEVAADSSDRKLVIHSMFALLKLYLKTDNRTKLLTALKSIESLSEDCILKQLQKDEFLYFAARANLALGRTESAKIIVKRLLDECSQSPYDKKARLFMRLGGEAIQFGVFRVRRNAESLAERLQSLGIPARADNIDGLYYVLRRFNHDERKSALTQASVLGLEYEQIP